MHLDGDHFHHHHEGLQESTSDNDNDTDGFMGNSCTLNVTLGFLLILEPFETDNATVPNPVFHFTLDHLLLVTFASLINPQVLRPIPCYQARL